MCFIYCSIKHFRNHRGIQKYTLTFGLNILIFIFLVIFLELQAIRNIRNTVLSLYILFYLKLSQVNRNVLHSQFLLLYSRFSWCVYFHYFSPFLIEIYPSFFASFVMFYIVLGMCCPFSESKYISAGYSKSLSCSNRFHWLSILCLTAS